MIKKIMLYILFFMLPISAQNISALIEQMQHTPKNKQYIIMNKIKRELVRLNRSQRISAIQRLKSSMQKPTVVKTAISRDDSVTTNTKTPNNQIQNSAITNTINKTKQTIINTEDKTFIKLPPSKDHEKIPIKLPIKSGTKVPTKIPVKLPIKNGTKIPVKIPTKIPVRLPIKIDSNNHIKIKTPIKLPIKSGPKAPIKIPVKLPIKLNSKIPVKVPVINFKWF